MEREDEIKLRCKIDCKDSEIKRLKEENGKLQSKYQKKINVLEGKIGDYRHLLKEKNRIIKKIKELIE